MRGSNHNRRSDTRPVARNEQGPKFDLLTVAQMLNYRPDAPPKVRRKYARRQLERLERRDHVWYMVRQPRGNSNPRFWVRASALEALRGPDPTRSDVIRADLDALTERVKLLQRARNADAAELRKLREWQKRVSELIADLSATSAVLETV